MLIPQELQLSHDFHLFCNKQCMESQHLGYSVRYISSIPYRSTAYYLFYFQTTPYRPYHFAYSFSRTEAPFPPGNINDFRYTSGERDRRFTSSSGFRSQNKEATYLINYRRPSGDTPLPEADIQQRIQPTNGRKMVKRVLKKHVKEYPT